MIEIQIQEQSSGGRIDKYLLKYLDKAPKSFIYKMMRKKNIVLNGKRASGNEILQAGDTIRLFLSDETIRNFRSENECSKTPASGLLKQAESLIVYEDENIIALNKPAGMLSQKSSSDDVSLDDILKAYLKEENREDSTFHPGISNRLDRNTSGIVLAGKNAASVRELNTAIKERGLSKRYWTLVAGRIDAPCECEAYLTKNDKQNTVRITEVPEDGSAWIKTAFRPLAAGERFSLIEVDLLTGRPHQIRAHMEYLHHPVAGDRKYGSKEINDRLFQVYGLSSQLLHAKEIEFISMTGILQYLNGKTIETELPDIFKIIVKGEHIWQPGEAGD